MRGLRQMYSLLQRSERCLRLQDLRMVHSESAPTPIAEIKVSLKNYKLHKLESGPCTETEISKADALEYYRQMKTIRCMEEAILDLFKSNHIRGQSHLATGQEACAVGISAVLKPDDAISCSHRNHAWAYLKGLTVHQILAEISGRRTGSSKGKGGSMHLYRKESNFFGGSAIVGSQVPLGAGMALAKKSLGTNGVSLAFYGEGAANQGQVFEAYNISKLWDLPVIFVCENNQIARQSDVHRTTAASEFYTRGDYIPGIWIDGMDILTVREAARWAVDYCRSGKGPIVLEMDTGHFHGHSVTATNYANPDLSDDKMTEDPVTNFKKQLLDHQLCLLGELLEIDAMVGSEIKDAVEKARNDPEPEESETYTEICTGPDVGKVRGCDALSFNKS